MSNQMYCKITLKMSSDAFVSFQKKGRMTKPKPKIEVGTQNKTDVDLDWLPEDTLQKLSEWYFLSIHYTLDIYLCRKK